jgi:ribosome-associated protein
VKGSELSVAIAKILDKKQAKDIKVLKIKDLTIVTDYIVIATGNSTTQVRALADEVEFRLKQDYNLAPTKVEGYERRNWILLDYDTVIVHVFLPEMRSYYNLDKLWSDGEEINVNLDD